MAKETYELDIVYIEIRRDIVYIGEVGGWGRVPSERWGAGVEYHFQEFNEPYAPS